MTEFLFFAIQSTKVNRFDSIDQSFLDSLNKTIEDKLGDEKFGVAELAHEIGVSNSQLHRRLHSFSKQSASQIIREHRLKKAKELLENEVGNVAEISYLVGFGSPSYFITCFHEYYGYSPGEVKIRKSIEEKRKSFLSKKSFLISISILAVLALVYYSVSLTRVRTDKITKPLLLAKSIAVLPPDYLSEDPNKQYLADAVMEAITGHLSKFAELRVTPSATVERYRETTKTARVIGKELGVSYLVKISFLLIENQVVLSIQLLNAKDEDQVFYKDYTRHYNNIIPVQSEIAQAIAKEINIEITPELKKRIEFIPTENFDAHQLYLKGKHYEGLGKSGKIRAIQYYEQAIALDPNFAPAYLALGSAKFDLGFISDYLKESYGDSLLYYAQKAIALDSGFADAYLILGFYYNTVSDDENSLYYLNKAIELNPNHANAYRILGWVYARMGQYGNKIISFEKAKKLSIGSPTDISEMLGHINGFYIMIGNYEKAEKILNELLPFEPVQAYYSLGGLYERKGEWNKMKFYTDKVCGIDSGETCLYMLTKYYMHTEDFSKALKYADLHKETEMNWHITKMFDQAEYGYILSRLNRKEEAEEYYYKQIEYCNTSLRLKRAWAMEGLADVTLFKTYIFLGKHKIAIHHLEECEKKGFAWGKPAFLQIAPQYKSIWGNDEFKAIIQRQEKKYADIRAEVDQLEKKGKL